MSTNSNDPTPELPQPLPGPRPPINVLPLDYYRQNPQESRIVAVPVVMQFLTGFLLVNACAALSTVIVIHSGLSFMGVYVCAAVGFMTLLTVIQCTTRWTGFVPGAAAGLLAAPVTFFFACALQVGTI